MQPVPTALSPIHPLTHPRSPTPSFRVAQYHPRPYPLLTQSPSRPMENLRIGFLGAGNMTQAIAGGMIAAGVVKPAQISASARTEGGLDGVRKMGISGSNDNLEVVRDNNVIVLSVKPHILPGVLEEVKECFRVDQLVISVVNMTTNKQIEDMIGIDVAVMRTLPNTPVRVRAGVIVAYPGTHCTPSHTELCSKLFQPLGLFSVLPSEDLINIASGLAGSSPAFLFMMVDAMADAGVRMGLPRKVAESLAAKAMEGSAKMVIESGEHPIQLANNVCSPGGTTIEGVYRLNRAGFKGTVMDAIIGSVEKSQGKPMNYNY